MSRRPFDSPPTEAATSDPESDRQTVASVRIPAPPAVARALVWGTAVALLLAVLAGALRAWVWLIALEPVAIGLIIGEAAAVPTTGRHRRPPRWSYGYVFLVSGCAYGLIHVTFWLGTAGLPPSVSLLAFLRAVPSATAAPIFQRVDLARQIALATGGATQLKYWLWAAEGLLMAMAAVFAYRGGSVRHLRG